MKSIHIYLMLSVLIGSFSCQSNKNTVSSPDGTLTVAFSLRSGSPLYSVYKNDTLLLDTSRLGMDMRDEVFSGDLKLVSTSGDTPVQEDFAMLQGKRRNVHYKANEKKFMLENASGKRMEIVFRVSNDGVAFRYAFAEISQDEKQVVKENTSFHFTKSTTAFLQPMSKAKTGWSQVNPCYEEFYQKEISIGTPSPTNAGWVYPALFHTGDHWLLVTESGLRRNYCGTHLSAGSPDGEYLVSFPDSLESFPGGGVNPVTTLPFETPWRVITIGSLKTIIESDLGVALADPSTDENAAYVKPGYASWSWALLKDDSTVVDVQKKFIDYAADMQWAYCLVDADWDRKIGYEKAKELASYASGKNIGLLLWYNSAGSWNTTPYTPKNKLLTPESRESEFSKLHEMGVKGIKIDFFGGDGQSMIAYYHDILKDAARHQLLVNFHGATIPRGWHRTYPNLMNTEAVKGFEYVTFEQANADEQPAHCAILPFTRNVFDPMDFTPLSLDTVPRIHRKTSDAFELALSVIFNGGIQHFVETPTGMKRQPRFVTDFLRGLPAQWDDTQFVQGYPGKDVVLARVYRGQWYVAGINGENKPKTYSLDLTFLPEGNYAVIADAGKSVDKKPVSAGNKTNITVPPNGGFVIVNSQ